jgi:hypothetical protein
MTNLNKAVYGAVMLALSGTSFAWDARTEAADHVVYWGGATASTLSAQELTVESVCDSDPAQSSDTNLFYVKSTTTDAPGNDWAIACRGVAGGKTGLVGKILVVKRDRGGSGVGVGPVQSATPISFLTVDSTSCTLAVTPGVNGAPQIVAPEGGSVAITGCTATYTTNALAEIGTSDIEPDKFGFSLNIPIVDGSPQPFLAGVAFGGQSSLAALVFNNPVTLALRNKLQEAQFDVSSVCNPANASYALASINPADVVVGRPVPTNAESVTCMPTLSRQEIDSLLTGRVAAWSQLLRADGTAVPGLTGGVQICRRVEGSGTQATINANISAYPCDPNRADGLTDVVAPRIANGTSVINNSGSGDVDNCLHNFNASANPYAIGNLSVEGRNTGLNRNWRFIKIDGVAPTLAAVHSGAYYNWAQQSIQYRAGIAANKVAIFNALAGGLNNPTTLEKLNRQANAANCAAGTTTACGSLYNFGQSGWLATPTSALVYDNVLNTARPVNSLTREVTTGKVNICQTPVKSTAGGNAGRGLVIAN